MARTAILLISTALLWTPGSSLPTSLDSAFNSRDSLNIQAKDTDHIQPHSEVSRSTVHARYAKNCHVWRNKVRCSSSGINWKFLKDVGIFFGAVLALLLVLWIVGWITEQLCFRKQKKMESATTDAGEQEMGVISGAGIAEGREGGLSGGDRDQTLR